MIMLSILLGLFLVFVCCILLLQREFNRIYEPIMREAIEKGFDDFRKLNIPS